MIGSKTSLFRRPAQFSHFTSLVAAESTRHGGVSRQPFASLNLGLFTPDDPDAVEENRHRFFAGLDLDPSRIASSRQVHGNEVLVAFAPGRYEGYDAVVTDRRDLFLTVTVADCTPILLFDPVRQAVGAVHAGWRGTTLQIVAKALLTMHKTFGSRMADCHAYIGTCIDADSYEVDADVADHLPPPFKQWDDERGKFLVDLKAANRHQLLAAGLPPEQIEVSPFSTFLDNEDYFSHRKEKGQTGRMLALIGMRG